MNIWKKRGLSPIIACCSSNLRVLLNEFHLGVHKWLNATHPDEFFTFARLHDVVGGLHAHEGVHFHAECLLKP